MSNTVMPIQVYILEKDVQNFELEIFELRCTVNFVLAKLSGIWKLIECGSNYCIKMLDFIGLFMLKVCIAYSHNA